MQHAHIDTGRSTGNGGEVGGGGMIGSGNKRNFGVQSMGGES